MPAGYNGKILHVDLSEQKIEVERPSESFYRQYMGGSCLGLYYLLKEMDPGTDPLSPENILVFAPSVVTGAPIGGLSRFNVTARSPLTGAVGDTQAGGDFGPELKFAGFDAVVIRGRAEEPVYLWISDGSVEIRPAAQMWGSDTGTTLDAIIKETGEERLKVAVIGPAGENMVRYACVMSGLHDACGRTGMGAVMGSKNLKAVAVRGSEKPELNDGDKARELARDLAKNFREYSDMRVFREYGTAGFVNPQNASGQLPTRNFTSGTFDGAEEISGETMKETITTGNRSCYACPVRCKQVVEVEKPYRVDPRYGGPEYETLASLGSYLQVSDLKAVAKANELCNRYALDTISTGGTIAFAFECFEKGIIDESDTGGLELGFGDGEAMLELIEMIAKREGIGDILAEGLDTAVETFGEEAKEAAVESRGQPLPAHEPRVKRSLALMYSMSPFGADHMSGAHDVALDESAPENVAAQVAELGIHGTLPLEDLGPQKVRYYAYTQLFYSLLDTLEICMFCTGMGRFFDPSQIVEIVNAVTGWSTTLWELMKVGERRINMMRAFNAREGFGRKDDDLPQRMFEPMEGGPTEGQAVDRDEYEEARELYYQMRGWNGTTGNPTPGKMYELGLGWALGDWE